MMDRVCMGAALAAAVALVGVAIIHGTWAAGGSDSSCYALTAQAFASGELQPASALGPDVPWPDAPKTLAPTGFVPSPSNPAASSPICAPGFSLLLAPLFRVSGPTGFFMFTPVAGAFLVWFTFLLGRALAGPIAGALSAVVIATSPIVLYQVVQPMNDVTTAALWLGVVAAIVAGRFTLGGVLCGLALLVRPNLAPLAIVAGIFVVFSSRLATPDSPPPLKLRRGRAEVRTRIAGTKAGRLPIGVRRAVLFSAAALPSILALLWLNSRLYGGPLRSGYGDPQYLFGFDAAPTNAGRYLIWLIETQTPFPLLALSAPFVVGREARPATWLALVIAGATCGVYLLYHPFDAWWYLRFLLPAVALMLVLASATAVTLVSHVGGRWKSAVLGALTTALVVFGLRTADARFAFKMQALEQRFRSVGSVARDRLPVDSAVLTVWDSGAIRFHAGREIVRLDTLDPDWLDRAVAWLEAHGHKPYIALETWEESGFRERFSGHSALGQLDWPPLYEVDRVVRIYDPADRPPYLAGQGRATEYLWPALTR